MPPTQAELQILVEARDAASAVLRAIGTELQRLEQHAASATRGALKDVLQGVGLGTGVAALDVALGTAKRGFDLLADSVVGINSRAEETNLAFAQIAGGAQQATQMLEFLRRESDRTTFPGGELIQAGQQLIPVVRGDQQAFEGLIRTAEVLAAAHPEQGIVGAAEALRRVS